jgi:hypothetical protein
LIAIALGTGTLAFLESIGAIQLAEKHNDPPNWGLIIAGVIFLLTGVSIFFAGKSNIKNLLASVITALMGALFGSIALFSDSSSFSGIVVQIALPVGIPIGNILFGLVSLLCFSIIFVCNWLIY